MENEYLSIIRKQAEALDFAWALIGEQAKQQALTDFAIDSLKSDIKNTKDLLDGIEATLEAKGL